MCPDLHSEYLSQFVTNSGRRLRDFEVWRNPHRVRHDTYLSDGRAELATYRERCQHPTVETLPNEIWKGFPVEGFARYSVSSLGRIKSVPKQGVRTFRIHAPSGSPSVIALTHDETGMIAVFTIARIQALAFLGPAPKGHSIHFINGDRYDRRLENMMYAPTPPNLGRGQVESRKWVSPAWREPRYHAKCKGAR